ncbi:peptidoglycan-binding protein [Nostoc sp. FACHB-110]|uniref:peptidoglycan-binding domain-containing protein n=1 Tax=Nostoc sp. FACHB-110 TaxID=2692834 RepID=UPI001683B0ED|nr:peptidoglycan-binding protein [Nostoc sp. FACHB-110]MBD2437683.1 peptidoglycan-binding protein [Nostoc sp. FACHB-110]
MKGSLTASILKYLELPHAFRFLSVNRLYWLLLLSSTPWLIGFFAQVAVAAPQEIAQAVTGVTISRPTLKVGSQGERVSELQAALQLLGFYTGKVDGVYSENTANAVSRFKQAVGLNPDGVVDAATWQKLFPKEPTPTANTAAALQAPASTNATTTKPEPRPANPRTRATQVQTLAPEPRPVNRRTSTQRTSARPSSSTRSTPAITFRQVPGLQYTSEGYPILRLGNQGAEVTTLQRQLQRFGFLDSGDVDGDFGKTTEAAVKTLQRRYGLEDDGVAGGATWEILLQRSPGQR